MEILSWISSITSWTRITLWMLLMDRIDTNMPRPTESNEADFADINVRIWPLEVILQQYEGPIRFENERYYVVYVDFKLMEQKDPELCISICESYHRLTPFLQEATLKFVKDRLHESVRSCKG